MAMNGVLELVKPVLLKVCNYYTFKKYGYEIKYQEVNDEIHSLFLNIKKQVDTDEILKRDYMQIEKPLVFFVDYILKESQFSFSRDYEPRARMYNELSGDDKFFDLLDAAFQNPNCDKKIIEVYYLMLGLGFDGAYKRDPKEVVKRMYECSDKIDSYVKPNQEILFPNVQPDEANSSEIKLEDKLSFLKRNILLSLVGILIVCFIINLASIYRNTSKYTSNIDSAFEAASPFNNFVVVDDDSTNLIPVVKVEEKNGDEDE